jgi:hypothetical protein
MTITITAGQRDALYGHIRDGLSGIGDVWLALCAENYEVAERLGREYSDDLRLVTNDLGWGDGPGGDIELTTPPDVLRRVASRMRDAVVGLRMSEEEERAEVREFEEHNRLVVETCQELLAGLDRERGAG